MGVIKIVVSFEISGWLEFLIIWPTLLYRRLRYGYSFRRIKLTQGKLAIVDADDYERLNRYKWRARISGRTYYGQRAVKVGYKKWTSKTMHRDIIDVGDNMVVDHINHNGLDNRKANLRAATFAQNTWNRRPICRKGRFTGVSWNKPMRKWRAMIRKDGKSIHIGFFDDEAEAAKAYDKAAERYRGEFAVLNFKK